MNSRTLVGIIITIALIVLVSTIFAFNNSGQTELPAADIVTTDTAPLQQSEQNSITPPSIPNPITVDTAPTPVIDYANPGTPQSRCIARGGQWDSAHNECTDIDAPSCSAIGGTWNECGSACRHTPETEICTQQCVQYCQL